MKKKLFTFNKALLIGIFITSIWGLIRNDETSHRDITNFDDLVNVKFDF